MKKFITLISLIVSLNCLAFMMPVQVFFTPTYAEARVYNNLFRPIVCSGAVQGILSNGIPVYSYFNNMIIYPGQFGYAYAYTNFYNPFINAFANANCF